MTPRIRQFLVLIAAFALAGCASVDVERYRAQTPVLDLRQYFNGTIDGYGLFQNRSGEVVKRFHVVIDARGQGDTGTLDERFAWADGSHSRRVWTLTDLGNGHYRGQADDVIGAAAGQAAGNALQWRYVLALDVDGTTYHVDFDDWMFLMNDKVMLNRSVMRKFGFTLGELTLSFHKR
jgi:hypothetical protein